MSTAVTPIAWTGPNQYGGFRSADAVFYIGQTPKGFWRLWVGDTLAPQIFDTAAAAKAHAETLPRPAPTVTVMTLTVTGANASKVARILGAHGIIVDADIELAVAS
jgi:hypothetical protein